MLESDDDRLQFFDPDEFGQAVVLTIEGQSPVTIQAIFDTRPPTVSPEYKGFRATSDFGEGYGKASGASPRLTCRASDVANVKPGRATAVVAGTTYNIFDVQPDPTGLAIVILKRA